MVIEYFNVCEYINRELDKYPTLVPVLCIPNFKPKLSEMNRTNLKETTNVDFVVRVHEHNVFKQPEERPRVLLSGRQQLQDPEVLKEEPAGALCQRIQGFQSNNQVTCTSSLKIKYYFCCFLSSA